MDIGDRRKRRTVIVSGSGQRIAGRHFISSSTTINVGGGVTVNRASEHFDGTQGSGRLAREPRELPAFDRIVIASCVDAEVSFGSMQKIEVEADDNLLDLVETTVQSALGSTLYIDVRESLSTENALVVHIQLPVPLHSLTINGSGNAHVQDIQQDAIGLTIQGSGDIRATGWVRKLSALVQGSGDLKLRKLRADAAELQVQGSGDIAAEVTNAVSAVVMGSGDITILGGPPARNTRVMGSGHIQFD